MSPTKTLSDGEAKNILRAWPTHTAKLFGGTEELPWIQAQPKGRDSYAPTPCLKNAGATALTTRPDGMWIRILESLDAADVFCVDVCRNLQNLQDKRSRFLPSNSALVLWCGQRWLAEPIYTNLKRFEKLGIFDSPPTQDYSFPVRYMRVLFVLREEDYDAVRNDGVAAGHEYFMKQSSLSTFTSSSMQNFLKLIAPSRHFYGMEK